MSDDEDVSIEDQVYEQGETVFSNCWDSGGPGAGADVESVWKYGGQYWADSSVDGLVGPYATFNEALAHGAGSITEATIEIECSELLAEEVFPLLDMIVEETDGPIDVNGEPWVYAGGRWARAAR